MASIERRMRRVNLPADRQLELEIELLKLREIANLRIALEDWNRVGVMP